MSETSDFDPVKHPARTRLRSPVTGEEMICLPRQEAERILEALGLDQQLASNADAIKQAITTLQAALGNRI